MTLPRERSRRHPLGRQPIAETDVGSRALAAWVVWLVALALAGCASGAGAGATSADASNSGDWRPSWSNAHDQSLRLAGGDSCFGWLAQLGIPHHRLEPTPGMVDPVRVTGPINGIDFISEGERGITCDCRMVLALDWSARALAPLGVTAIRHSGAYVYRTTKSGRPSLHARGLAIDVHAVDFGGHVRWVEQDFERGRRGDCDPDAPALNRVECQLRALQLFRELITPDDNHDHHDHLHLAISPLH